jgi:hypothetical protein
MTRQRVAPLYLPVVYGGGGGVGAMFAVIGGAVLVAVLAAIAVAVAYPSPTYQPVTDCAPFCSQLTPATTAPVGGEQR